MKIQKTYNIDDFKGYLNLTGVMAVVLNTDKRVVLANQKATQILACEERDAIGKDWFEEFVASDSRNDAREAFERMLHANGDSGCDSIGEILTKAGETRTIIWTDTPLENENGETIAIVKSGNDISEQFQAEKLIFDSAANIQAVLNAATQVSIIATDQNGLLTTFNTGAERMLGYMAEEVVGKENPGLFHLPSEVEARGAELSAEVGHLVQGFDVFTEYARQGRYEERDWTYVRKDGSHITVNMAVTAVRDSNGEITGFLGSSKDVTEARESESKFRSIYEGSYDAIMLMDHDGFFDCNPKALEIFGYESKDEFIELDQARVSPQQQADGQDSSSQAWQHIQTAMDTGSDRFDWVYRRKDGTYFQAEVLLSAFNYQGRRVVQATARDITERIRYQDELVKAKLGVEREVQERTNELQTAQGQLVEALSAAQGETDKIKAIIRSIGDGVFVLDGDRNIVLSNRITAELSGYTEEELMGVPYRDRLKFIFEQSGSENTRAEGE